MDKDIGVAMLSHVGLGLLPWLCVFVFFYPLRFILMSQRLSTSEIFSLKSLGLLIELPPTELAGRSDTEILFLESH